MPYDLAVAGRAAAAFCAAVVLGLRRRLRLLLASVTTTDLVDQRCCGVVPLSTLAIADTPLGHLRLSLPKLTAASIMSNLMRPGGWRRLTQPIVH